jgi:hypothetical protein
MAGRSHIPESEAGQPGYTCGFDEMPQQQLSMNHPQPVLPHLAEYPSSMFALLTRSHADPRARERRSFALGLGGSVLIHLLLLLATLYYRIEQPTIDGGAPHPPIAVRLAQRSAPAPRTAPPPPAQKERPRSRVIAVPRHAAPSAPVVRTEPEPPKPHADEPIDMAAMVNAARQRRQQAEDAAARENADAAAASQGPSGDDVAMANIRRSLDKRDGTGGVFQILHKGVRTATFAFRGWTPGSRNSTYQTYEVDAGLGGNVELAIVRRMIELIRTHYTGDFNWESHRLGRVIVKSARPQDNAELESFLMKEFFGDDQTARAY